MANAAPYIAQPLRRMIAGVLDLVVLLFFVILAVALVGQARPSEHIAVALFTYGLYHAAFLSLLGGATPAQRVFDMRIVSVKGGSELSVGQTFLRSMFRPMFLYAIGWTAIVVSPPPSVLMVVLAAPLVVELGMMFTLPTRQTLADLVARTLVINVPPPQPHRAPAAPMYSATDAEFGVRPRVIRRGLDVMWSSSSPHTDARMTAVLCRPHQARAGERER
jgi:uncharacterized RDD family membrane protein YckC